MKKITEDILSIIKSRPVNSYKGTFGKIVLIGGNANFGGAIIMATMAAVYSGAGLVTTVTDNSNQVSLHSQVPEAMFQDINELPQVLALVSQANVIVIGPGLGTEENSKQVLTAVFKNVTDKQTLVVDGSALTLMAQEHLSLPTTSTNVLTPHQMEWQRVSNIPIAQQNPELNQQATNRLNAIAVVKSSRTQVYSPNTEPAENTVGTPAQATGGMGDTLAGMIGGFLCQFGNDVRTVEAAVYTHSAMADEIAKNQYVVLPHQISMALPKFMKKHEH
ncbi:NAD(P)H-hydrate dehydratase [Lentilactobacillus sp. SPB1-3]|uniref:NAD(P)H-hydrate dehydratase n=1 Tax=Lentilactobacillus terminaliae TaxID=3003483 RepID=A0ACD5DHA1_9LACO|nr:NAD(P)H-hydrate dehydratase [Lentilactobacillus sp. SPB1-3]MCZ0977016.1 NAD(P)H-hydrate dehydratase [Lentilactobacillus sp. SPB1-3]